MNQSGRLFFVPIILLLACSSFAQNSPPVQAGPAIPESAAGLQTQLEEILRIKVEQGLRRREDLISQLRMPDPDGWFASCFGNDDGAKLAATYRSSWEKFQDSFAKSVTNLAEQERTEVSVKEFRFPAKPVVADQNGSKPADVKPANVYYTATATKGSMSGSPLPGVYTYARGAFRVVDWQTLYTLPYMRPTRIRIGGNVAAARILKQVTPEYPAEARAKKVSGTVILHVVLGREGYVVRVDFVSGPPELMDASMNAVRQWKYQPTLLNGDPVEVDTTVAVQFKLK